MYNQLVQIIHRPKPFEFMTIAALWTDSHRAKQMLAFHLDEFSDIASRKKEKIHSAVAWMIQYFNISSDTSICDFGCGPGLYTNKLAKTGADVTGIDFSASSLNYARSIAEKEQLFVNYIEADYLKYETDKRYDLISLIYCDYCALSPENRIQLLKKFHRLLNPGGKIFLDVFSLQSFNQREEISVYERNQLNGFWSAKDYFGFLNTLKYEEEKVVLDKHTIIEEDNMYTIYNWLQYFDKQSLINELHQAGFKFEHILDDITGSLYTGTSPEIAIVAGK